MKTYVLLAAAVGLGGVGFAIGLVASSPGGGDTDESPEVVVRTEYGSSRTYTLAEAAARIERLEWVNRRRRERGDSRYGDNGGDDEPEDEADTVEAQWPPMMRPDGRPYTFEEIVKLARESDDMAVRRSAVRALRRYDTDAAREELQSILADESSPKELKVAAAEAMARWPHRDKLAEELVTLLGTETDPDVRFALVQGVARMSQRRAYMSEISGLLGEETDDAVRGALFRTVTRSAKDPAAKLQLLDIATGPGTSLQERQGALAALSRMRPDADMLEAVAPLLDDSDSVVRVNAMRILAGSRNMTIGTLAQGLDDQDPAVRTAALQSGMRHLKRMQKNKAVPKAEVNAVVARTVELAGSDADAGVRRSAIQSVWHLPKKHRDAVLATGRNDSDPFVRLTAYAYSPRDVSRSATPDYLSALESRDPGLRNFAYNQLKRLHGVKEPFNAGWNDKARAGAAQKIREELAGVEY